MAGNVAQPHQLQQDFGQQQVRTAPQHNVFSSYRVWQYKDLPPMIGVIAIIMHNPFASTIYLVATRLGSNFAVRLIHRDLTPIA
jgi:hypothetical protein